MQWCIPPTFKIGMAACLFSPLCSVCIRFCKSSLLMADIRARSFKRLQPKSCRTFKSTSSNAPIRPKGLSFCRDVGLSNAPLRGLIVAAAWAKDFDKSHRNALAFLRSSSIRLMLKKALSELL